MRISKSKPSTRTDASSPRYHGQAGARPSRSWTVSALETYVKCPFKFFAQDVLRLEEPVVDEAHLSPRSRGRFIHEVFQRFFEAWDARGLGTGSWGGTWSNLRLVRFHSGRISLFKRSRVLPWRTIDVSQVPHPAVLIRLIREHAPESENDEPGLLGL